MYEGDKEVLEYFREDDFILMMNWDNADFAIREEYGNDIHDMVVGHSFMFAGRRYYFEDKNRIDDYIAETELGICLKLNDDGKMVQHIRGSRGGFTVTLNAHVDSYILSTNTRGFVVFIRDQHESVLLNQGGYIIAPGSESFMRLSKKKIQRLKEPHGTCENTKSDLSEKPHFQTVR